MMKGFVAALLLFALATPLSGARAATPANTLVVAKNLDDVPTLDPAEVYELSNSEVVVNVYDRLMGLEKEDTAKLVPTAAESYEVSPDGSVVTFKLRPNLTFTSGNPVRAADVLFSYRRVLALNLTPAYLLQDIGWTKDNIGEMVRSTGDLTLEVRRGSGAPLAVLLNTLSTVTSSIVDEKETLAHEVNGDFGHEWLKSHSAGSGAFSIRSWKPGEALTLQRHDGFRRGKPGIERVVLRHVPEPGSQLLLLEKADVDIARNLSADQIKSLKSNPDIVVDRAPKATIYYLGLSQKIEPLKNPKVQEALRWLVDYEGMTRSFLDGRMIVNQSFWPPGFFAALGTNPYKLDVAKAKQLLAEAGYPNGFEVGLDIGNTQPYVDIGQSIQATFAQAGVKVNINSADTAQVLTKYRARNHNLVFMYWGPDFLDPHANAISFASNADNSDASTSRTIAWRNSWDIPDITKRTAAAAAELDLAKRKELYFQLQKDLREGNGPYVYLFQEVEQAALRSNVKGFFSGPNADLVFYYDVTKK